MADPIAEADGPACRRPRGWIASVALIAIASRVVSIGVIWLAGLANVLFGAGLVMAALVLARTYGDAIALRGAALLAFSPPAFVFSLAYSEALFLALAAAYFLLATAAVRRSLLIASAVVSRVAGVGLVAAAFATAWRGDGSARRVGLVAAGAGLIAFGTWWTFIAVLTHDPFGFLHGALGWKSSSGLVPLAEALRSVEPISLLEYGFVGLILAASFALVRQDRPLAAFAICAVSLGLVFGRESSIDRYALAAFPAFGALGRWAGRRGTVLLLVLFVVGEVLLVGAALAPGHPIEPP
jgi:hypothetical protein